ncbi:MAG: polysaccharide deacetylase family protein [Alistipes sp.]
MILLSFDIEEFDVPKEHEVNILMDEQVRISAEGTNKILDCLQRNQVQATFFCTANFAQHAPEIIHRILAEGHEVASHGFYHWTFEIDDLKRSKEVLETLTGTVIRGYRQARMMPVPEAEIKKAGYEYNSSLNPTFIPGRYMHLSMPRTCFLKEGVLQIPASVTPWIRFPLFWLSYHNLPATLYRWLCARTLKHDGYFVTYFHPWEFYPLANHPELKMPFIIRNHAGEGMERRLDDFIHYFKAKAVPFVTFSQFVDSKEKFD